MSEWSQKVNVRANRRKPGECGNNILAWKFLYTSASDVQDGGVFAMVCFATVGRKSQPRKQEHICTLAFE